MLTDDELNVYEAVASRNTFFAPEDVMKLVVEVRRLRAEESRLRKGDFTEEEFQNLCHNLDDGDERRFKAGCEEYQRKLFGRAYGDPQRVLPVSGECLDGRGSTAPKEVPHLRGLSDTPRLESGTPEE